MGALKWSGKGDSNSRPRPWQGRALPTELFPPDALTPGGISKNKWRPLGESNPCRRRERAVS
jgi:hypothetical protein